MTGRYGYDLPVHARVALITDLARALSPPARPRPVIGPAIGCGLAGLLALWNLPMVLIAPSEAGAWLGALFFTVMATGSLAVLQARHREVQVTGPLVDGAMRLWRWSWYCSGCGVVSVVTPTGSTVVEAQNLASSLMDLSRRTRWQKRFQPDPNHQRNTVDRNSS